MFFHSSCSVNCIIRQLDFITKQYSVFSFKNTGLGKVNVVVDVASVDVLISSVNINIKGKIV